MIVILNGPAGCGKDTIAEILNIEYEFYHHRMKDSLIQVAAAIAGIPPSKMDELNFGRESKETKSDLLCNMSPREWLIHTSEVVMKPLHGDSVFGKREANRCMRLIRRGDTSIVYSDGGFPEELEAMAQELGEENILLVRLRRDGYTFDGDSRSYLESIGGMPYLDIKLETGKPEKAVQDIMSVHIQMLYGEM